MSGGDPKFETREAHLLHVLQHSLGLDRFGRGTLYRNHFVTGEGSLDHPTCMEAVERGLMTRQRGNPLTGGDDAFFVTADGKAWVFDHSPKPDRKQRARDRYSRFLDISDVMPDLTFAEFLRRQAEFGPNPACVTAAHRPMIEGGG